MAKKLTSASLLAGLIALATAAGAATWDKKTYVTFDQPVAVPGRTLPAGTYMFRLANPTDASRNVIQVANRSGSVSYALLHAMPAYRPDTTKESEAIRFRETSPGAVPAIDSFWYVGEKRGFEFIYSKEQLAALEATAAEAPASPPSFVDSDARAGEPVAPAEEPVAFPVIDNADVSPAPAAAGEPVSDDPLFVEAEREQAALAGEQVQSQPAERREELPRTASPLALLLLGGAATASLGVKLLRRS
jgi:hypothetical protein